MGLAVGVEKLAGVGLPAQAAVDRRRPRVDAEGSFRRGRADRRPHPPTTCRACSPRSAWSTAHKYGGVDIDVFAGISENNHSQLHVRTGWPLPEEVHRRRDQERHDSPTRTPVADVLGNCDGAAAAVVVSGEKLKTLSLEQQRRAVKVVGVVLTSDPYEEACEVLPDVNTLTRNAAEQAYEQAGVGPSDLDLVDCTDCFATADLRALRQPDALRGGRRRRLLPLGRDVAPRHDPGRRVGGAAVEGSPDRGDRHRQHLGGLPPPARRGRHRQIEGAKVGLADVIGLGSACACTSSRSRGSDESPRSAWRVQITWVSRAVRRRRSRRRCTCWRTSARTASAKSSGVAERGRVPWRRRRRASWSQSAVHGVATRPGATAFTRIGPYDFARCTVMWFDAAFVIAHAIDDPDGRIPGDRGDVHHAREVRCIRGGGGSPAWSPTRCRRRLRSKVLRKISFVNPSRSPWGTTVVEPRC